MKISILISSLSSQSATVRMRIWRSIKSCGAVMLRDGVYLLPFKYSSKFDTIIEEHITADGSAYVFHADCPENLNLIQLFDRKFEYDEFLVQLKALEKNLDVNQKNEHLKTIRKLRKSLTALIEIDFFPNELQHTALNNLSRLELKIAHLGEIDEPNVQHDQIQTLSKHTFQNKVWVTRKRPWIDRLACAWLIQKFIDHNPTFLWLNNINDCPPEAIGFDFDGATFTHINDLVSFEVLLHSFNLETPALKKVAEIVHYLDIGGNEPPEAIGFEKIMQGLRSSIQDDDQLVQLSNQIFDGLFTNFSGEKT
ncbi:chromate resistance protein ChrB domain-containing protein [Acinetobacter sp. AS5]|uniref:chromate resistance protein ChrB domain-containing protein n=1 Tax=Acinetobacter sp. AS5 TaxID=3029187 RepID=UPI003B77FD07